MKIIDRSVSKNGIVRELAYDGKKFIFFRWDPKLDEMMDPLNFSNLNREEAAVKLRQIRNHK